MADVRRSERCWFWVGHMSDLADLADEAISQLSMLGRDVEAHISVEEAGLQTYELSTGELRDYRPTSRLSSIRLIVIDAHMPNNK